MNNLVLDVRFYLYSYGIRCKKLKITDTFVFYDKYNKYNKIYFLDKYRNYVYM